MTIPLPADLVMCLRRMELIRRAFDEYGTISLCSGRALDECFREYEGRLQLLVNDLSGSTHTISE